MFAHLFRGHIAREAMEMDRGDHGFQYTLGILGSQARHHSRQDVASSASRPAWIPRGIHPDFPVGIGDQSTMTLQHQNDAMVTRKFAGDVDAVPLNRSDG